VSEQNYSVIPRGEFGFITLLRGPAALLVVYSHFVGQYLDWLQQTYWLKRWVTLIVERPLMLSDHFGQLGVMIFFLISGFIITHVARSEAPLRFAIRRIFRIYPAYWAIIGVIIILGMYLGSFAPLGVSSFNAGLIHNWRTVLKTATITNYLFEPQNVVLGVGWTLQIEVLYYALILLVTPLIRRRPMLAMAGELVLISAILGSSHAFGANWFLFAANVAYLPYMLIGQAIYFYWAGGLSGPRALFFGLFCYLVIVFGLYRIHTEFLQMDHSRILPLMIALAVFVWALVYGQKLGLHRVSRFFSDISYSLYLVQGPFGLLLIFKLHPLIGYGNAAAIALVAVLLIAYLMHRFIERPTIEIGRRISNHFKTPASGVNYA
jgi:peptidoglycan/LPS O-acetylase OafA/YrhL